MVKLTLALLCFSLSGCSVMMAASSEEAPTMSVVRVGATKTEVEKELGRPITDLNDRGGSIATYQYFTGDEVSYERAVTYAVLDGVTLGLAELITFPAEALQGDKNVVTVRYDRFDRVIDITHAIHQAPLDKPEKIIGIESVDKGSIS